MDSHQGIEFTRTGTGQRLRSGLLRMGWAAALVGCPMMALSLVPPSVWAQDSGRIEMLTGHVEPGRGLIYVISELQRGQTLYVYANGTSGNLDPFVALADYDLDRETLRKDFQAEVALAISEGRDPCVR